MSLSIQTNYANLVGQHTLNKTQNALTTSMERLSTGYRINSASDDAAGLQISNRLEAQGRGMNVAMRNAGDATSQMQTAEGAMDEMTNIAYRMNDLATQAANGSASDADRTAMNSEFSELANELSSLMENTNLGGQKLLDGNSGTFMGTATYQIGSTSAETLSFDVSAELGEVGKFVESLAAVDGFNTAYNDAHEGSLEASYTTAYDSAHAAYMADDSNFADKDNPTEAELAAAVTHADAAGIAERESDTAINAALTAADTAWTDHGATLTADSAFGTDFTSGAFANKAANDAAGFSLDTQESASQAIDSLSGFIDDVGATRSAFGANINRLDHTVANLGSMIENTAAAKSRIMDTDMAAESSSFAKNQMLMQSGAQMMQQTKMVPQLAMSLL